MGGAGEESWHGPSPGPLCPAELSPTIPLLLVLSEAVKDISAKLTL